MNDIHMQQILNRYIDDFEKLNDPEHMEYYKWQIVKKFRPMMDEALETDGSEFAEKLMEAKRSHRIWLTAIRSLFTVW